MSSTVIWECPDRSVAVADALVGSGSGWRRRFLDKVDVEEEVEGVYSIEKCWHIVGIQTHSGMQLFRFSFLFFFGLEILSNVFSKYSARMFRLLSDFQLWVPLTLEYSGRLVF